jgi:hypothetical protein
MRDASQFKPISDLKAAAAEVLTPIPEQRELTIIPRNGQVEAASQDVASFEESQETLALLKILAIGSQDVAVGKLKPVTDVVARLRGRRCEIPEGGTAEGDSAVRIAAWRWRNPRCISRSARFSYGTGDGMGAGSGASGDRGFISN